MKSSKNFPMSLRRRAYVPLSPSKGSQKRKVAVFTALHGMQTRSSDENYVWPFLSVCPSVCQTRAFLHKMLSYRRETALQGALVFHKSGRLELKDNNVTDIIGLSSTTVT